MMLEASVGGAAPGEFNEDLDHEAKAALVKCFIQAVSISVVGTCYTPITAGRSYLSQEESNRSCVPRV